MSLVYGAVFCVAQLQGEASNKVLLAEIRKIILPS